MSSRLTGCTKTTNHILGWIEMVENHAQVTYEM